ncbi:MAG: YggS family pyridoxal phosphate-dependent enzyme [Flavobacteriaceae bacterium]|nr:MAG: YggS family pyridoxal phosphate-dependent enzyme [Flavobacteriaceae bacterium]
MNNIETRLKKIHNTIPGEVTLVAVSKTKPVADIRQAYDAGQRIFGENKVQEMVEKYEVLPKDIEWHMIGHLQRNKVKYMAHFVHLIHGVANLKTLIEINKQAKKYNRVINCLLQTKIADEDTKFGLSFAEIETILSSAEYKSLQNARVVGCMGMATLTDDQEQLEKEFSSLKLFFDHLKKEHSDISILSMGMSADYPIAIKNGSTMIRIGSSIFGVRNYNA